MSAPARRAAGGRGETLRIQPAFVTNDGSVARHWAEQGLGLVLRSEWDAAEAVASGSLVRVLADWNFDSAPVVLLVPSRKGRTARVQALVGFMEEALQPPSARPPKAQKKRPKGAVERRLAASRGGIFPTGSAQRMPKIFRAMMATSGTPHSQRMMLFMRASEP